MEEAMGPSQDRIRNELFSCSDRRNVQIIQQEILNLKNLMVGNNFFLSVTVFVITDIQLSYCVTPSLSIIIIIQNYFTNECTLY